MKSEFLQPPTGEKEIGRYLRDNELDRPNIDPPDGGAGGAADDLYGEDDKEDYVNPPDPPDGAN